jgi:hypothetical protein
MSQVEANGADGRLRTASWGLLLVPLISVLFVYLLDLGRRDMGVPSWLTVARVALAAYALCVLAASFLIQRVFSAHSANIARETGQNPNLSTAVVCILCSVSPSSLAMILAVAGAPASLAYTWAPISLLGAAYWGWRYRHVLGTKGQQAA